MIYLDNAATTPMAPEVIEAMKSCFDLWQNPSENYEDAIKVKKIIDTARSDIAELINCKPNEIIFTSGGSEGDNFAIKGVADAYASEGRHIITSEIEHKAVLNTVSFLSNHGYDTTLISPDERGFIHVRDVVGAIRDDTILVSIMYANNEIGTIQPIREIAEACREKGVIFHTDAVQAFGHENIDVEKIPVDLLSVSSHKFNGPKGAGFVYIREGTKISPLIHGGKQENGLRGGTENILGIVGTAAAAKYAMKDREVKEQYIRGLRDYFIEKVLNTIPGASLNGSLVTRLSNNVSLSFQGVMGESALAMLDIYGICASSGSACNSGDGKPSHVLTSIGLAPDAVRGTLRFTLSADNTIEEVDYTIMKLKEIIGEIRSVYD